MDIRCKVIDDLKKVMDENSIDNLMHNFHFSYGNGFYEPGIYIYEEKEKYYYIDVGDRGGVENEIKSSNIEDILYRIYSSVTFNEAVRFASVNKEKNSDWRKVLFKRQLELLMGIGEIYYKRREKEIEEILSKNPYHS